MIFRLFLLFLEVSWLQLYLQFFGGARATILIHRSLSCRFHPATTLNLQLAATCVNCRWVSKLANDWHSATVCPSFIFQHGYWYFFGFFLLFPKFKYWRLFFQTDILDHGFSNSTIFWRNYATGMLPLTQAWKLLCLHQYASGVLPSRHLCALEFEEYRILLATIGHEPRDVGRSSIFYSRSIVW